MPAITKELQYYGFDASSPRHKKSRKSYIHVDLRDYSSFQGSKIKWSYKKLTNWLFDQNRSERVILYSSGHS